jgi:uncharacterized caspase-like protein
MSRDALVIGINEYTDLDYLENPANDAKAIAKLLETKGGFRVKRLLNVAFEELEDAIVQLFNPESDQLPETALLFFAGHGLRKLVGGIAENYLASSDVNPQHNNWGLSLQFLQKLLQKSKIKQQIVWLDCCYSGELLNFEDADPGERGKGLDRCFIAACREYEQAYEETTGNHGVLTGALLPALDPTQHPDGVVDNFTLVDLINQKLKSTTQQPLYGNSGSKIILTGGGTESITPIQGGICPYKGLEFFEFNDEDPKYFYGRKKLTDELIEIVGCQSGLVTSVKIRAMFIGQ